MRVCGCSRSHRRVRWTNPDASRSLLQALPARPHMCVIASALDSWKPTARTECDYGVDLFTISADPVRDIRASSPVTTWHGDELEVRTVWVAFKYEGGAFCRDGTGANVSGATGAALHFFLPSTDDAARRWSRKFQPCAQKARQRMKTRPSSYSSQISTPTSF